MTTHHAWGQIPLHRQLQWTLCSLMLSLTAPVLAAEDTSAAGNASPPDPFWQFLTGGKVNLYLRYRFEHVDDAQKTPAPFPVQDAYANTLRTALGYTTGLLYHFGATLQVEDVRVLGREMLNDGGNNGITSRARVVDPEGTEIQQANIRFEGTPKSVLRYGRQEIEHRQAPLHRYIGNILWRQNWQSFDAFRAITTYLPDTTIDYAYVWNTNRIFGEDNPVPDRSDYRMD